MYCYFFSVLEEENKVASIVFLVCTSLPPLLYTCVQMLEARSTDGKYDLTLQLKTEVLITRPSHHSCSVLYSVWRFVAHRCRNCLVRQLNCGSRFKGQRRSFERHSGWWRGNSLRCVCVCVCVWCVGWCVCVCVCVQCMYDSRTLDLAVGMPLQVETLQKEVQHLRKASMLHSHTSHTV